MFDQSTPTYPLHLHARFPIGIDQGFTLIEMAIVLLIITLLLSGLLVPLSTQVEQRKIAETQKSLEEIKEALIGFAIINGRLPCPAKSATEGDENVCTGTTPPRTGFIPWVALGVPKLDAWGHVFRYSVTPAFTVAPTLTTPSDITIKTRDSAGAVINLSNPNTIPVLVLSHGRNGYGAVDNGGVAQSPVPVANADEVNNTNVVTIQITFFSRPQSDNPAAAGGEFDDIVVWLSPNILFNRMVAAGKLP